MNYLTRLFSISFRYYMLNEHNRIIGDSSAENIRNEMIDTLMSAHLASLDQPLAQTEILDPHLAEHDVNRHL